MKVLLAGSLVGKGGVQSHLRWLIKILNEEGIELLVFSLSARDSSLEDWQELQETQQDKNKIQFFLYSSSAKRSFGSVFSIVKRLIEITKVIEEFSPDVYYAVGTGWILFIPPLLAKTKALLIFHEVMSGVPNGWRDSRWGMRWWFDEVIAQSPTVACTFSKIFNWKKPILALPAIPEPLEITAQLPKTQVKVVELGKARAALFSRLVPHKQALWLVQQWHLLKDTLWELHIHGSGPEESLIREYIETQEIGDRVKCFGSYPEGQAYVNLLNSYDLTLLPTIGAEGAPLVLLESMACGVPFVAYGVGGIPDYGVDNPNVLIVAPEPNAFIMGIKQMVTRLAEGSIDQSELQSFYFKHYSYQALKTAWLSYLCPNLV